MKYFIGYLMEVEAAEWHIGLTKNISEKFGTWKIYEKIPPHITIARPFEIEDIGTVKEFLRNWAHSQTVLGNICFTDFDHFKDRVIFVKVEMDQPVLETIEKLRQQIIELIGISKEDFPFIPHSTLANKLSPEEINKIWEYISTLEKPDFRIPFDNATIFRQKDDSGWTVEEVFKFN